VQGVGVFKYGSVDSVSVCMGSGGEGGTGKFCSVCVLWRGEEERKGRGRVVVSESENERGQKREERRQKIIGSHHT